jgi:hypothetical protein
MLAFAVPVLSHWESADGDIRRAFGMDGFGKPGTRQTRGTINSKVTVEFECRMARLEAALAPGGVRYPAKVEHRRHLANPRVRPVIREFGRLQITHKSLRRSIGRFARRSERLLMISPSPSAGLQTCAARSDVSPTAPKARCVRVPGGGIGCWLVAVPAICRRRQLPVSSPNRHDGAASRANS